MKNLFIVFLILIWGVSYGQTDHSEFLQGPFDSPQAVTETCLMCHEEAGEEIMKTRHWNWLGDEFETANGKKIKVGKKNLINNFCIAVSSNWPRCTSCHIGYGWKDETFDFSNPNNIDCLVCHDQTGTYKKEPTGAGMPAEQVNLADAAISVGKTTIKNCSDCHFNGGGGSGVKHGDMDESLIEPSAELDVHMGGLGFTCTDCHTTENHKISGASHGSMAAGNNHISCTGCHGDEGVHEKSVLNNHLYSVACETCHIPTFAREEPTKTWWDWSTAGKDKEVVKDKYGMPLYNKKKGSFVWKEDVVPEYFWHNGKADYYRYGDKIDTNSVVQLNKLAGSMNQPEAKIAPFKVMRGKQIYDSENNYLIVPKLFGKGGYWKTFDWNAAAEKGMKSVDLAYSGNYGFVKTAMYWPINHMVAPAEQALKCADCHSPNPDSRLDWKALGYRKDPKLTRGSRVRE